MVDIIFIKLTTMSGIWGNEISDEDLMDLADAAEALIAFEMMDAAVTCDAEPDSAAADYCPQLAFDEYNSLEDEFFWRRRDFWKIWSGQPRSDYEWQKYWSDYHDMINYSGIEEDYYKFAKWDHRYLEVCFQYYSKMHWNERVLEECKF